MILLLFADSFRPNHANIQKYLRTFYVLWKLLIWSMWNNQVSDFNLIYELYEGLFWILVFLNTFKYLFDRKIFCQLPFTYERSTKKPRILILANFKFDIFMSRGKLKFSEFYIYFNLLSYGIRNYYIYIEK